MSRRNRRSTRPKREDVRACRDFTTVKIYVTTIAYGESLLPSSGVACGGFHSWSLQINSTPNFFHQPWPCARALKNRNSYEPRRYDTSSQGFPSSTPYVIDDIVCAVRGSRGFSGPRVAKRGLLRFRHKCRRRGDLPGCSHGLSLRVAADGARLG